MHKPSSKVDVIHKLVKPTKTPNPTAVPIKKPTAVPIKKPTAASGKPAGKKRGRYNKTKIQENVVVPSCKYCNSKFSEQHICQEHEDVCQKVVPSGQDIRDKPDRLDSFVEMLGLVRKPPQEAAKRTNSIDDVKEDEFKRPPVPVRNLRRVASRSKIGPFIKAHPMPITSLRGQQFLEKFDERKKPPTETTTPLYEKDCCSKKVFPPPCDPNVSTLKKHLIKRGQHLHYQPLGARDRRRRNIELIVGLSTSSFKLYNKCKPGLGVKVKKLSKKIVEFIEERDKKKRAAIAKRKAINFEAIVKKCTPVIQLRDVKTDPEAITASQKKLYRINLTLPQQCIPTIKLRDVKTDPKAITASQKKLYRINLTLPQRQQ